MKVSRGKIFGYLSNRYRLKKSNQGWYRFNAEYDNNRDYSQAYHPKYNIIKDFRMGKTFPVLEFLMFIYGGTYQDIIQRIEGSKELVLDVGRRVKRKSVIEYPEGYKSIFEKSMLAKRAKKYLKNRGLDLSILDQLDVGYCDVGKFFGHIIFPFKHNHVLKYYVGRNFIGGTTRYKNPKTEDIGALKSEVIFNYDALNIYDTVFIFEGITDALTIGHEGIAICGNKISNKQFSLIINSTCKNLVFVPDKGFYRNWSNQALKFLNHKKVYLLDLQYTGNAKDANDIGKKVIVDCFKQTNPYKYADYYKYF